MRLPHAQKGSGRDRESSVTVSDSDVSVGSWHVVHLAGSIPPAMTFPHQGGHSSRLFPVAI